MSDLTYDGAHEIIDGIEYIVRIEADDIPVRDLWSDECYGKLSEYDYDYSHDAREPRPDGMDGRAEKIQHDRGYWTWWQTPDDVKVGSEGYVKLRALVRDLLEMGYSFVTVTAEDGYTASLSGIEPDQGGDYLAKIATELVEEIQADRTRDHHRRLVEQANRWLGTRLTVPT